MSRLLFISHTSEPNILSVRRSGVKRDIKQTRDCLWIIFTQSHFIVSVYNRLVQRRYHTRSADECVHVLVCVMFKMHERKAGMRD